MIPDLTTIIRLFILLGSALTARVLIPKMQDAESAGVKFGIGVILFLIYNVVCVFLFHYVCSISPGDPEQVLTNVLVAFGISNLIVLITACIYFISREKRKLSQNEKMKLKDL